MYILDGDDFLYTSQNITFLAGGINTTFHVAINDDDIFEINEIFNLTLLIVPSARSISIVNGTTTVFIVDNDSEY